MFPNYRGNMNFPSSNQQSNSFNYPANLSNNFNISNIPKQNMNNFYMDPMNAPKDVYPQNQQNKLLSKSMNPNNVNYSHEGNMNQMNIINPQPTKTLKSNSSVFIPNNMSQNVNFFNNIQNPSPNYQMNQMNPIPNMNPIQNLNTLGNLPNMSPGNNMNIMTPGGVLGNMNNLANMGMNGMTSTANMGSNNHMNPNLMPLSNTPPLNNYKMPYPSAIPFKQATPNILSQSVQINNNFIGFSLTTPPPMQINEINSQMNIGMSLPPMQGNLNNNEQDIEKIVQHILNLRNHDKREEALHELSKKRESFTNLAPYLWYSVGTLAILLQEIVSIYPFLAPAQLSQPLSNRVCNVLGLLQCLALHSDTRSYFISAHIPLFLYPFLNTSTRSKPFENLRVSSLGVIGALVKGDDSEAIHFLMQTEIIPLCLRIMKRGLELSRTVATFIVQKILNDDKGLNYISQTADRFFAVSTVLQTMIEELVESKKDDQRLLRHIIKCYLKLSENPKSNEALRKCLPGVLRDINQKFIVDENVKKWHFSLLKNLGMLNDPNCQDHMN